MAQKVFLDGPSEWDYKCHPLPGTTRSEQALPENWIAEQETVSNVFPPRASVRRERLL
jgi:hypothetical protein